MDPVTATALINKYSLPQDRGHLLCQEALRFKEFQGQSILDYIASSRSKQFIWVDGFCGVGKSLIKGAIALNRRVGSRSSLKTVGIDSRSELSPEFRDFPEEGQYEFFCSDLQVVGLDEQLGADKANLVTLVHGLQHVASPGAVLRNVLISLVPKGIVSFCYDQSLETDHKVNGFLASLGRSYTADSISYETPENKVVAGYIKKQ